MGSLSRPYSIKKFKRLIDYLIYLLILLIERNNTPIPQSCQKIKLSMCLSVPGQESAYFENAVCPSQETATASS
jgi:hypothetical protein